MTVIAPPAVAPLKNQYIGLNGLNTSFGCEIAFGPNIDCKNEEYVFFDLEYIEKDTVRTTVTDAKGARLPTCRNRDIVNHLLTLEMSKGDDGSTPPEPSGTFSPVGLSYAIPEASEFIPELPKK